MTRVTENGFVFPPAETEIKEVLILETKSLAQNAAEEHQTDTSHVLTYRPKEFMCKEEGCGKAWRWNKEE